MFLVNDQRPFLLKERDTVQIANNYKTTTRRVLLLLVYVDESSNN